jgi:outer membrane protein assembly factor BamD
MDALSSGNYQEAQKIFQELSGESGYVKYSVLAKLRLGDTLLANGDYEAAEYVYDEFLSQYRGDPNEAYAYFRKCQTHAEQLPGDVWLLPPGAAKDMAHVHRADACYKEFLGRYGDSRFQPEAQRQFKAVRTLLYRHERYVADFYWRHDNYPAVVLRLKGITRDFPEFVDELLYFHLVTALVESKDLTEARQFYKEYALGYPGGRYLQALGRRVEP